MIGKLAVLCSFMWLSDGANILVMLPLPLYSHTQAYMPVIKALSSRGHNVTMVSPFPQQKPTPNLIDVEVPKLYDEITEPSMFILSNERSPMDNMKVFWDFGLRGSATSLKQDAVKRIISAPSTAYDLIITETFFLLEPMTALGYKFRCPVVNLHPWGMTLPVAYFTGNPLPSSYQPSVYTSYSADMTFLQRTKNTLINAIELIGLHWYYLPRQDKIMREHLEQIPGFERLPYITDLLRNTSLTLLDVHFALDYQRAYFRNIIEIGGMTVNNKQQVSKELKKYMDDSVQGFIYFSLGSHLPSSMLPPDLKNNLFKVFGKLNHNVIMKWDSVDSGKPQNVRIEKWLPQNEILGHPNCKLFITHGGLHSIQEAIYNKVPIVGLPLVADQPINMIHVQELGLGISVNIFNATEDILKEAITKVITDDRYKRSIKERSAILKDYQINSVDNAVYHIEYIMRHKGAAHLTPPSLQRSWYELLLLDVILLLIVMVLLFVTAITAFLKFLMLILCTKKKHKEKKH